MLEAFDRLSLPNMTKIKTNFSVRWRREGHKQMRLAAKLANTIVFAPCLSGDHLREERVVGDSGQGASQNHPSPSRPTVCGEHLLARSC